MCLDDAGAVVRPALLWNDTRSAAAAVDLVTEFGGAQAWADAGLVPVASFTVTKLRWLAEHEPASAKRTATVLLPHDYVTWRLAGAGAATQPVTDRGDASGTGYWSASSASTARTSSPWRWARRRGSRGCSARTEPAGRTLAGVLLGPGTGDNMAAALGVAGPARRRGLHRHQRHRVAVHDRPTADPTGIVAGFADATGRFLLLVCTLNAARVLSTTAALLGTDFATDDLALSAPPGAAGVVLIPYFGERTPNCPNATASVTGLRLGNTTPANLARAAVEGLLCGLADGLDALRDLRGRGPPGAAHRRRRAVPGGPGGRAVAARRSGGGAATGEYVATAPAGGLGTHQRTGTSTVVGDRGPDRRRGRPDPARPRGLRRGPHRGEQHVKGTG